MLRLFILLAVFAGLIVAQIDTSTPQHPLKAPSRTLSTPLLDKIERLQRKYTLPGLSISITTSPNYTGQDWQHEEYHFGKANWAGDAVTAHTVWGIASNSKLFVAIALGMLIENKTVARNGALLDWSTRVCDVLPEWKLMDDYPSSRLQLTDLLSMRSGLPRHDLSTGWTSVSRIVSEMRHLRPSREIRQEFQYNNLHYIALAHVVSTLTGVPYHDWVTDHIIKPLHMSHTTYNATLADEWHRSEFWTSTGVDLEACALTWSPSLSKLGKECVGELRSLKRWNDHDELLLAGCGGVKMSGSDMNKWMAELLEPQIIPRSVLDKIVQPVSVMRPSPFPGVGSWTYGFGQMIYSYKSYEVHGHTGGLPGQYSWHGRVSSKGLGIYIVTNDEAWGPTVNEVIAYMILDEMLDQPVYDWEALLVGRNLQGRMRQHPPVHPRRGPSKGQVEGRYAAPGYGEISLVHVEASVLSTLALGNLIGNATEGYIASVDKLFNTHLVFLHLDGPLFTWFNPFVKTSVTGELVLGLQDLQTGTAVWTEEGFGMFDNYWGGKEQRTAVEEDVERHAEVFYGKL